MLRTYGFGGLWSFWCFSSLLAVCLLFSVVVCLVFGLLVCGFVLWVRVFGGGFVLCVCVFLCGMFFGLFCSCSCVCIFGFLRRVFLWFGFFLCARGLSKRCGLVVWRVVGGQLCRHGGCGVCFVE
jgi:hypothetical protein